MSRFIVPLILLAVVALPGTAEGTVRQDARRFVDAVAQAKVAIADLEPQVAAASDAMQPCLKLSFDAPEHARDRAESFALTAFVSGLLTPAEGAVGRLVAQLEAIRVRDPALRAGRMAWRRVLRSFEALPHVDDACAVLERWRADGWRDASEPPDLEPALRRSDAIAGGTVTDRWMLAAGHRLVSLGVRPRSARLFMGEAVFDPLLAHAFDAFEALFEIL